MKKFLIYFLLTSAMANSQDLTNYQQEALENNPQLKASYALFEAAMQRIPQVNALPDPTLSIGYFISPVETRVGPQRARFSITQMFPWFGTLKAQGDVAALEADARFQAFQNEQNNIEFQVARAYYPLLEVEELLSLEQESQQILKTWKSLATSSFENGLTSLADVLRVDLRLQESETQIRILEEMRQPLVVTFNRLLNRNDTSTINLNNFSDPNDLLLSQPAQWDTHPLLRELNLKIQSKEKQIEAAKKQGMPRIGFGLDYVLVEERTDMNVPRNGRNALMPMVSIGLPIFRGKYKGAQKEAEFQIESLQASTAYTQNTLVTSFENLAFDARKQQQLINLYENLTTETLQIQELLLSDFTNSGKNLDELLRIQIQLINYKKENIKAKTRLNTVLANIDYVIAN